MGRSVQPTSLIDIDPRFGQLRIRHYDCQSSNGRPNIHPAIQVGLGDLFIAATQAERRASSAERTLLVETHSEHIMLRLLRRVREQTEDKLPPGVMGLLAQDISVVYVEATERGPNFRRLRVSEDGDFLDTWPKGFFEERAEELF